MMRFFVLFLCFYGVVAHVKDLGREHSHISTKRDAGPSLHGAEQPQALLSLRGSATEGRFELLRELPQHVKGQCVWMLAAICFMCCCGGALQALVGQEAASHIGMFITVFCFVYLLSSGIYSAYARGENVGTACKIMCWWVIFMMFFWSCFCCLLCCGVTLMLGLKNEMIKKMRAEYEEKMQHISGPRKDYYESDLFKQKCDRLFEKADSDGNGTLDMKELQGILVEVTGDPNIGNVAPLLQQAFEEHGDSVVEKHEFVEMMKFVSVVSLQEGTFTVEQAFEILQCPETASKSEVRKAYYKLAAKYHPDKQSGDNPEKEKRDMACINDAHAKVQEHFKEIDEKSNDKEPWSARNENESNAGAMKVRT